jgi:hypothetical protein
MEAFEGRPISFWRKTAAGGETALNVGAVQFDVAKVWIWPGSAGEAVVAIEGVVQNGGPHLEHEVGASR